MIIDCKTIEPPLAKARTNTIVLDKPLHHVATTLHAYLQKNHPRLLWYWAPAPVHARNTRFDERLDAEREQLYTAIFGAYDANNAKFLNWRRIERANATWLLCTAYALPQNAGTPCATTNSFQNLGSAALIAWVELLCLWLIILEKPKNATAWSDACGPGAAWFVGLITNKHWSSAFRVGVHVVASTPNTTALAVSLVEKNFFSPIAAPAIAINPATRIGSKGLLAWSNLFIGEKRPVRKGRTIFDSRIDSIWQTKWPYYNAVADALKSALHNAKLFGVPSIFCATHAWCAPKIVSADLPIMPVVNLVDLSFQHDPLNRVETENVFKQHMPKKPIHISWTDTLPAIASTTTPTFIIQPSVKIKDTVMYCWYLDKNSEVQWIERKEDAPKTLTGTLILDPYSTYKIAIAKQTSIGALDTRATQAIAMDNRSNNPWLKTTRELLMQSWWVYNQPIYIPDCTLATQSIQVWHMHLNQVGHISLVCMDLAWNDTIKSLQVNNIVRNKYQNTNSFYKQYPGSTIKNGFWLEDAQGNKLEISTESLDGFIIRGDKHPDIDSLLNAKAESKGPRTAKNGKVQKVKSDQLLSRSAAAQLLPYYTKPGNNVAQMRHKDTVYLQEQGQRLRVFVPPYGPLDTLDGFRQFRVVRLWDSAKSAYAPWALSSKTPDLLYWYLRTLTWDLLQIKENSQMCMLEKMARECQIGA